MLLDESNFTNGLVPKVGLKLDKACFGADNTAHSHRYTVYKSLVCSVCKIAVILLCSLVNLTRKLQKANRTIDTVQVIALIYIFLTVG